MYCETFCSNELVHDHKFWYILKNQFFVCVNSQIENISVKMLEKLDRHSLF